jgi:glycosyltransferase involved in cell wall biosynthesis
VIVFLVTEDWYFWSHRLPLARAARAAGARVIIATRVEKLRGEIEREGFEPVALPWRRRSHNPWNEVRALIDIMALYRRVHPDIVHHVAVKPVVYGGIAARLAGARIQVNAIAGLGYVETSRQPRARVLRAVFNTVLRFVWSGPGVHVIVQNPDDREALSRTGLVPASHIHMIRGSGVDVARFAPSPEPPSPPVRVVYGGRLLWSKGIRELVEAARALKQRGAPSRFPPRMCSRGCVKAAFHTCRGAATWLQPGVTRTSPCCPATAKDCRRRFWKRRRAAGPWSPPMFPAAARSRAMA